MLHARQGPTIWPVGNLTFSEIIWILVIILIVFGPQRLPEMARKVGQFVSKARDAATALQRQINEEYGDAIAPLRDVGNEIKEARRQLTDGARAAARDVEEAMTPPAFPAPGSASSVAEEDVPVGGDDGAPRSVSDESGASEPPNAGDGSGDEERSS